jgi:hypothetical protein
MTSDSSTPATIRGRRGRMDFARINAAALEVLEEILEELLPDGYRERDEWVALNPTRDDRNAGSFRISLKTGKWCDFALPRGEASGSDPVSLYAYLLGLSNGEAARCLASMLGLRS